MTEEAGASTPEAPEPLGATPAPATEGTAPTEGNEMFSSSEGMVSFGGGLLIAGYLLFGLILNDYWVGWLALLFAVLAVLVPRANRSFIEKFAPLNAVMKAVGYTIAIVGVFAVIENIRFAGSALDDFTEILGALVAYAGYAIAFLGARSIEIN